MPIHRGRTKDGKGYYQYGKSGKKYYYKSGSAISRNRAKQKAVNQMIAIHSSGFWE